MKREIKFRAWDEGNKVMHHDFQFIKSGEEGNDWIVFRSDKQLLCKEPHPFDNPYLQQQFKIMQFTGLYDKDGREIYEGDILQSAYEGEELEEHERGVVEYGRFNCSCCGGVYGWSISNDKADLRNVRPDSDPSLTVIGNIYENPELLGE